MSFVSLGLAAEFGPRGVAVNALWPRTVIATDAINMIPGVEIARCRTPEIVADAAHVVLTATALDYSGRFLIDEDLVDPRRDTSLHHYSIDPSRELALDLFLDG
jgi:citronellol/citronellal dehydrogenase